MLSTLYKNSGKLLVILLLTAWMPSVLKAQLDAYFSSATFNTPLNKPFVETYLTIVGKSLQAKTTDSQLQNAVTVEVKIKKDSLTVLSKKYRLHGPLYSDPSKSPSFIDNQRYPLPNGAYAIELILRDDYDTIKKPLTIKSNFTIYYNPFELQCSSIQALETFYKSESPSVISKSGYELVPYTVNYYPESSKFLSFYFEVYNANILLGDNQPFLFTYYLESRDTQTKLNSYGSFKKQTSAAVNPLLAKLDISKLGSGNYNLVIEVKNSENKTVLLKKYPFERFNRAVDVVALQNLSETQTVAEYFGQCNNTDTLKMFVECLWPIADNYDKERIINQSVKKDARLMKNFVIDFWQRRAADTANPLKLWANYYKDVQHVMVMFKCGKQPGYYTDRGRVYLQYGAPSQRSIQLMENNTYPYEIWQYYRTTDAVNGQFFSNRKFVFVNKQLGDDCYLLVHSDMRGEINNPRWQFELTRRNNNGLGNPDNNTPAGTQFNQFDEIYSNPR